MAPGEVVMPDNQVRRLRVAQAATYREIGANLRVLADVVRSLGQLFDRAADREMALAGDSDSAERVLGMEGEDTPVQRRPTKARANGRGPQGGT